ncbi:hypothetical protein KR222_005091 [Zaprionus bogoriensis]|nr:hypothetical protein KR222_005091 [Zaprionus bogoriensis]
MYELPASYEYVVYKCICDRPHQAFECQRCRQYFYGRIAVQCMVHPLDSFLMDFRHCPFCLVTPADVKESPLSWQQIRQMEDAQLPNDSDDFSD